MTTQNSYNNKIFKYDLDAYGIAVKDKEFKDANIFANRIMSNASLLEQKKFGLIGYILKEIANDGINLQQSKDQSQISDYTKQSARIVGKVITMLEKDDIQIDQIWIAYNEHQNSTNKMFMSNIEYTAYLKPDSTFSKNIIDKLIIHLDDNKKLLQYYPNRFVKGILNEIGRISKDHSLDKQDEHFVSLLRMFQRIDDYVKENSLHNDFIKRSEKEILPFAEKIINLHKALKENNSTESEIDELLWQMIKAWRLYFIKFLEVGQPTYTVKQDLEAPESLEQAQLIDEITKHIEEEAGMGS